VINKILEDLTRLQTIDLAIKKIEDEKANEDAGLHEIEARIQKLRERETLFLNRLDSIESKKRQLEIELKRIEAEIEKTHDKSLKIATSEEYHAILTEIETKKKIVSDCEDQILEVIEEIESIKKDHEDPKEAIRELENDVQKLRHDLWVRHNELQEKVQVLAKEREAFSKNIPSDILSRYNQLIASRNGIAVVECKDTICYGCYMGIPPQMYNQLKRGDMLHNCPSCQRFIYYYEFNVSGS
jgi:predicted  nucleic acid-binding Zn-ribbon protein